MADEELGLALKVLRVIRGWTRGDLARASGLPKERISAYERGMEVPDLKTAERILAAMDHSLQDLQTTRRFTQAIKLGVLINLETEWPAVRS